MTPTDKVYPVSARQCTRCLLDLPFEKFHKTKNGKYGIHSQCKKCCAALHTEWARKNREKVNASAGKYYQRNRERIVIASKEYRDKNFETYAELKQRRGSEWMKRKIRAVTLYKYHVNEAWFNAKRESQGGCCGICGSIVQDSAEGYNRLCIDHDHACCPNQSSCGKCVRGLLCRKCNIRLNSVDDLEWLQKSVTYLNGFRAHPIVLSVPSEPPAKNP